MQSVRSRDACDVVVQYFSGLGDEAAIARSLDLRGRRRECVGLRVLHEGRVMVAVIEILRGRHDGLAHPLLERTRIVAKLHEVFIGAPWKPPLLEVVQGQGSIHHLVLVRPVAEGPGGRGRVGRARDRRPTASVLEGSVNLDQQLSALDSLRIMHALHIGVALQPRISWLGIDSWRMVRYFFAMQSFSYYRLAHFELAFIVFEGILRFLAVGLR